MNVNRKGLADARSGLVSELVRIRKLVYEVFKSWDVEYLFENVDSADKADVEGVSTLLVIACLITTSQVMFCDPRRWLDPSSEPGSEAVERESTRPCAVSIANRRKRESRHSIA